MLLTPANEFQTFITNFGSTYSSFGQGTSVNAHASTANTKGTAVSLISGASVTEDVYAMKIEFHAGASAGAIRRYLADILIDPAGGTSWSVAIPNLFVCGPSTTFTGYHYYFPLYLKSGTSIGCQQQCSTANNSIRVNVTLFCKPSRPDLVKCGSKVEAFGVTTGTTSGTSFTPGSETMGSYASLGTTTNDLWWWQGGGYGTADTTLNDKPIWIDYYAGDGSNKKMLIDKMLCVVESVNEGQAKPMFGTNIPIRHIKGGETVYARAAISGTSDTTPQTTAYGLGG